MAEIIKRPKGTNDVLPNDSAKWQFVERKMLDTAALYGYKEIRTPVFEHTEVFSRGVGDTTDVVQKEMYTFEDKGNRSITLRPEFTAGIARSVIENGLVSGVLPIKACYIGGCYRYEKPQAGRLREFHQFGIECIGTSSPVADAEAICLANDVLQNIGIKKLSLEINSIGCPVCRKKYHAALKEYFESRKDELCGTCRERLERNPMRILDCKSPVCKSICETAPVVIDYLCEDCQDHFEKLKRHLDAADIKYTVNPKIVRGLDYYTKTVFEFVSGDIGAQSTVCGGGRYDGLISQLGGADVQAVGFAMGIERLLLVAEAQGVEFPKDNDCDVFFATMTPDAEFFATKLCKKMRTEGFKALTDVAGRGFKAQFKYSDKLNPRFICVLGEDEIKSMSACLKNKKNNEQYEISLDNFVDDFYNIISKTMIEDIENTAF